MASKTEFLHFAEEEFLDRVEVCETNSNNLSLHLNDNGYPCVNLHFFFHSRQELLFSLNVLRAAADHEIKRLTGNEEKRTGK